jgi:AraC-like DNA-binding protein
MTDTLASIKTLIAQHALTPGRESPVDGIRLLMSRTPGPPEPMLFRPMLYLVLQGAKQILLDDCVIDYGGGELVVMAMDLPALTRVTQASDQEPYLAVELPLPLSDLTELATEMRLRPEPMDRAVLVRPLPEPVLDPLLRLLQLHETPTDAKILAAGVRREIIYRMLASTHGSSILQMVRADGVLAQIRSSTEWMRDHVDVPVHVGQLADRANMSVTSFHRHFKAATGTTPVSYHKRLRLHEARRLIAGESESVARVAARVGYASPSQFSRDYKRAFGASPGADPLRRLVPREPFFNV